MLDKNKFINVYDVIFCVIDVGARVSTIIVLNLTNPIML